MNGKERLWQHNLTLLAPDESERAKTWQKQRATLSQGRYLLKIYVTSKKRPDNQWLSKLNDDNFVGKVEFQADWRDGCGGMTKVDVGKPSPK